MMGIRNTFNRKFVHYFSTSPSINSSLIKVQAVNVLNQEKQVLTMLQDADYIKKCPSFYNASVGGHVRHLMDHYQRVVYSHVNPSAILNYDERRRDTAIENDKEVAIKAIDDMIKTIPNIDLSQTVAVSFMGDEKTFESYTMTSTIERELSFVAHHGVHHLATIKLMMNSLNYVFDSNSTIGVAVSTVKDNQERRHE